MAFPPGYHHNLIASSTPSPIMYLDLSPFLAQIRQTLSLVKDNVEVASPQGRFRVQRYRYRAAVQLRAGAIVGASAGGGGAGPGGIDVVAPEWEGMLVIDTEGTTEHAEELVRRCSPPQRVAPAGPSRGQQQAAAKATSLQPYRIIRERSRPGKLYVSPIGASRAVRGLG